MAIAKKKKKFWDVDMPLLNKQTQLYGLDIKELDGRIIVYDLTRILKGKSMLIQLKVIVKGDKATSVPRALHLMPYFLRRMVRKGTDYVEDSFSIKCKDAELRIKPFLITRRKVSRVVKKALREKAREELEKYAENKTTDVIFEEILRNKLQKPLSLKLKKTYPLSLCEIRVLKVEKELEPEKSKEKEEPKEEKIPKEEKKE